MYCLWFLCFYSECLLLSEGSELERLPAAVGSHRLQLCRELGSAAGCRRRVTHPGCHRCPKPTLSSQCPAWCLPAPVLWGTESIRVKWKWSGLTVGVLLYDFPPPPTKNVPLAGFQTDCNVLLFTLVYDYPNLRCYNCQVPYSVSSTRAESQTSLHCRQKSLHLSQL